MVNQTPDASQNQAEVSYEIYPTGPARSDGTAQHTDIGLIGLFGHHVTNINSVRQAIWQRYSAMLVANSFFVGFVNTANAPSEFRTLGSCFGVVVGCYWLLILNQDWRFFNLRLSEARRFKWPVLGDRANPIATMSLGEEKEVGQRIFRTARRVIYVFILLYISLALFHGKLLVQK